MEFTRVRFWFNLFNKYFAALHYVKIYDQEYITNK